MGNFVNLASSSHRLNLHPKPVIPMRNKLTSNSPFNSCLLATLVFLPWCSPASAQSPGALSKLNVGDGTGSTTGDGTLVAEGKYNVSPLLGSNYQTAGSRMLWYPRKSAFRAGYGDASTWSEATLGAYSAAIGYQNRATGLGSTSTGYSNTASNYGSTAMGYYGNTASGFGSTAMGYYGNIASGSGSTAMGYYSNTASGDGSTAIGYSNTASGFGTTAMGVFTTASAFGETVIGSYNESVSGDPWNWRPTDPVFQIGNGHWQIYESDVQIDLNGNGVIDQNYQEYLPETFSNAITVYKNGNMELQGNLTLGGTITSAGSPVLTTAGAASAGFLTMSNGLLNVPSTILSSSSTTGALTVAGGIGVTKDSYINGVRIGKGNNNVASNTAVGANSLSSNTSGSNNTAVGTNSQMRTTTGVWNTSVGKDALHFNNNGNYNSAVGAYSLYQVASGYGNSGFGALALFRMAVGSNNTALGSQAGYRDSSLADLTSASDCIFVGANTRGSSSGAYNSIVIGTNAVGLGSNTTVIGNDSTTLTRLRGETELESLRVTGQVRIEQPQGDISMGIYGK